jgi:hypothetical protein
LPDILTQLSDSVTHISQSGGGKLEASETSLIICYAVFVSLACPGPINLLSIKRVKKVSVGSCGARDGEARKKEKQARIKT